MSHSEGGAAIRKRGQLAKKEADSIQERIETKPYSIKTVEDVQDCLSDIINGVFKGVIKKDKAGPLSVFLPLAFNIAKHQEGRVINNGSRLEITVTEKTQSMIMKLSDEDMDAYINGDESMKAEVIEKLKGSGSVSESQSLSDNIIDLDASEVEPLDIKINHNALVKISKGTDIPLTKAQSVELFGASLADPPGKDREMMPNFDATGFGEIFEKTGLPEGGVRLVHKFIGKYKVVDAGKAQLWYTCKWCGKCVPNINAPYNVKKEVCEKAQND